MNERHPISTVMALGSGRFVNVRGFVLAGLALAGLFLAGSTVFGQQKETPFEQGMDALKARDYDAAIADFTQVIQTSPRLAQAYFQRGFAYMKKSDATDALADYTQAIQIDPNFAEAYYRRAFVYMELSNDDAALADLAQAIKINPRYDQAYFRRSFIDMSKGNYDEALADINEAIALNPNFQKAYVRRSFINLQKGDYAQTIANIHDIIQRDPTAAESCNRLAWLLAVCPDAKFRNGPEAVKNATKACDLTQWNRPAFIDTLAAAYAEAGDFNDAVKWETQFLAMQNVGAGNHSDAQARLALYQAKQPYHVASFTPQLGIAF